MFALSHTAQKRGNELLDATIRIGGIFVLGFFVMYGNVFRLAWQDRTGSKDAIKGFSSVPSVSYVQTNTFGDTGKTQSEGANKNDLSTLMHRLRSPSLAGYLQTRVLEYKTPFSLLPPGKYLRIHRLGVQAPIVDVTYASDEQMKQGKFHDELMKGVVKYPFTANPGEKGNTLIFGHSSVDFRESKENPFGFIFSHINELQPGDTIEMARNGKQYFYEIEESVIKNPNEVNDVMKAYTDDHYLTLMACYPRFSTAKRILVVAKQVDGMKNEQGKMNNEKLTMENEEGKMKNEEGKIIVNAL